MSTLADAAALVGGLALVTLTLALIDYLLAPAGFWGHSAEDADAEPAEVEAGAETPAGQLPDGR